MSSDSGNFVEIVAGTRSYKYKKSLQLGKGSFGTVYFGQQTNIELVRRVAVKKLKKKDYQSSFSNAVHCDEITICDALRNLRSKYLVAIFDVIVEPRNTFVVMEWVAKGSLKKYLLHNRALKPHQVWQLARHISYAMVELNSIKLVHRDIKPDNILVHCGFRGLLSFKLTDFGVSRFLNTLSFASTFTGTPGYYAPETLFDIYDNRCDVFSLGVVLLESALGKYPFDEIRNSRIYAGFCATNQLNKLVQQTAKKVNDRDLRKLMPKMLAHNVNHRVTVEQLVQIISFHKPDSTKLVIKRMFGLSDTSRGEMKFESLDDVIFYRIMSHTSFKDRVSFQGVNKKWFDLLQPTVGKRIFEEESYAYDWFGMKYHEPIQCYKTDGLSPSYIQYMLDSCDVLVKIDKRIKQQETVLWPRLGPCGLKFVSRPIPSRGCTCEELFSRSRTCAELFSRYPRPHELWH